MYVPGVLVLGVIAPVVPSMVKPPDELNTPPVNVSVPFKSTNFNLDEASKIIDEFFRHNTSNGWIEQNRHKQDIDWMKETLNELILLGFYSQSGFKNKYEKIKQELYSQQLSAFEAAEHLYLEFRKG